MLCVTSYPQDYIDDCRARVQTQVAAYTNLISAARAQNTANGPLDSAIETFEPTLFNNMVMALDNFFCHRSRAMEKKDGNALNEVRLLCQSLMDNGGKMTVDKTIKFDAAKSVLKYRVGDEIRLSEADFLRLSEAFFAEIESKYPQLEGVTDPA